MTRRGRAEWTNELFVKRPELFLPFLERRRKAGELEAGKIAKLFRRYRVPRGGRILDLCCGIGRHSVPLGIRGYRVIGLDISPTFTARARRYAASKGVASRTKFAVADYRQLAVGLAPEPGFHGAINLFTSIGYYGEETDRVAFRELARHMIPPGTFILRVVNRDWVMRHFERRGWDLVGDILLLEERHYDPKRSHMVNRWEFLRQKGRTFREETKVTVDHRIYGPRDLRKLLEATGWRVRSLAATLEGDPFDLTRPDRSEIVAVAVPRNP